jgi:hypothetical protein
LIRYAKNLYVMYSIVSLNRKNNSSKGIFNQLGMLTLPTYRVHKERLKYYTPAFSINLAKKSSETLNLSKAPRTLSDNNPFNGCNSVIEAHSFIEGNL